MNPLNLEATKTTPFIRLEPGKLIIRGRSIHEDTASFYQPLIDWVDRYAIHPEPKTVINLKLEYVNSHSNKLLLQILKILDNKYSVSYEVQVNWYYEEDDETILNLGKDFESLLKIPFHFIQTEE